MPSQPRLAAVGPTLAASILMASTTVAQTLSEPGAPPAPVLRADVLATEEPSVHPAHVALAGGLLAATITSFVTVPQRERGWSGGIAIDDGVRDGIALGSRSARDTAVTISDLTYYASVAYPALVDPLITTARSGGRVPWRTMVINTQSFALTGLVSVLTQRLVARERPFVRECAAGSDYDGECGDAKVESQSFLSGHTAMAFTGASLTCWHHLGRKLYGGGAADAAACATAVAAASTTGVTRMMADKHYFSDVISGAAVGVLSGYLMPTLLHGGTAAEESSTSSDTASITIAPAIGAGRTGLAAVGTF